MLAGNDDWPGEHKVGVAEKRYELWKQFMHPKSVVTIHLHGALAKWKNTNLDYKLTIDRIPFNTNCRLLVVSWINRFCHPRNSELKIPSELSILVAKFDLRSLEFLLCTFCLIWFYVISNIQRHGDRSLQFLSRLVIVLARAFSDAFKNEACKNMTLIVSYFTVVISKRNSPSMRILGYSNEIARPN